MEELRKDPPTVLVLEDMHWADEATLDVFRLVARRIGHVCGRASSSPPIATTSWKQIIHFEACRQSRDRAVDSTDASAEALRVRCRGAREAVRSRRGTPVPHDVRQSVLRDRNLAGGVVEQILATVRDAVLARVACSSPGARACSRRCRSFLPKRSCGCWKRLRSRSTASSPSVLARERLWLTATPRLSARARSVTVEDSFHRTVGMTSTASTVALEGPMRSRNLAVCTPRRRGRGGRCGASLRARSRGARILLGAHREAAAQYRRALRFAQDVSLDERAQLLEQHSHECYLTDAGDEAVGSLQAAIDCYRELGDRRREGATLSRLAGILWCRAGEEARRVASRPSPTRAGRLARELASPAARCRSSIA
jgi:hypothetical protein